MPRPPIWYLQKIDLFADLSDEEMMELIEGMEHKKCNRNELLYTPDDCEKETYILKEGEVTLYQMANGKRMVVDILKPGSVFGNIGFDHCSSENSTYAEISQEAYICVLPPDFFLQMMQRNPKLSARAFNLLSKRLSQYQSQLRFLSMLNAKDRILTAVQLINQKDDKSILPEILRMPTKITHEKLASMTGLTRETVTKQLQQLEDEGFVHTEKKNVRITDAGIKHIEELL